MRFIGFYLSLIIVLFLVGCQSGSTDSGPSPTGTAVSTVAPTTTATPTVDPTATATPVNYRTFISRDNGLVFVLPQTWERKVESGGLQIFCADANLVVSEVTSSTQT